MKTKIIQALLSGKTIQVNTNPLNKDSKNYWVDLNTKNRDQHHLFAALFTDNDDYPLFRIKPEPKVISYRSAMLRLSGDYIIFTVNSFNSAAELEKQINFVEWISDWNVYNIEDNTCEK